MRDVRFSIHRTQPATNAVRFLATYLLAVVVLFGSLPLTPAVYASHPAQPGAVSPQPQDSPTPVPTPAPTPDEVLEQAKRDAAIAEELKKKAVADQERAEAEAAKLKSETQPLGAPSVTVPTGSVQTDAAGWVESQMLSHEAARQITQALTKNICTGDFMRGGIAEAPAGVAAGAAPTDAINTLVVYNNSDLTGVEMYNSVYGQLEKLKLSFVDQNGKANGNLDKTDPETPPAAGPASLLALAAVPGIATGVIKSVAELVNLFRTDTSFTNKSVQISEDMVISHVVKMLSANNGADGRCASAIRVFYPSLFPAKLTESKSDLVAILNDVEQLKNESVLLVERMDKRIEQLNKLAGQFDDRAKKTKEIGAKKAEFDKNKCKKHKNSALCKKLDGEIKALDEALVKLEAALANVQKNPAQFKGWVEQLADQKTKMQSLINSTTLLSAKLNTPDESTKLSALTQLFRAEKLSKILSDPQAFTLRVAVTANGTTKVKKNIFVDAKVRHSAGASLVYQLFNKDGALAQGSVMQCYIDYRSARDVQQLVSGADPGMVKCRSTF